MGTVECKIACIEMQIEMGSLKKMKKGKACYKAGNEKCRQDGKHGIEASLLCKKDIGTLYNITLLEIKILYLVKNGN